MSECRKAFEAAHGREAARDDDMTYGQLWAAWRVAWDAAISEAATTCDEIGGRYHAEYKTGRGPGRANPHTDGKSDGAFECEQAILTLRSTASEGGGA